mmetsp:Transcript_81130/g.217999  ORF Transcript_81130/g.217999 Transcript_81130/m.217999 type:complete len:121 (+) Transcript_81130:128-490(+)
MTRPGFGGRWPCLYPRRDAYLLVVPNSGLCAATASSAPEEGHPPVALEESLPGEGEPAPVPAPGAPTEAWNEGSSMASPGTGNWTSRGPPGGGGGGGGATLGPHAIDDQRIVFRFGRVWR